MVNFNSLFGGIYKNKKVLITGHTGFKGSWLALWLDMLGADVCGYALAPPSDPAHFNFIKPEINDKRGDVRNYSDLESYIKEIKPEIVFHLAAQPLVRASYDNPLETYSTNVIGTLNVLDICRKTESVRAIVVVTSDKCYENREWVWGYRENDPMGGFDIYSSSKGCAELLTSSFRNSFLNISEYGKTHNILLATARAGNVIGGGDWADDRLVPDIVKAASANLPVAVRNPKATRPWQHVLEPLSGYLTLGWRLLEGKKEFAEGWNFGPDRNCNLTVDELARISRKYWDSVKIEYKNDNGSAHEAHLLMLDCSKADKLLKWKPVLDIDTTVGKTVNWYKNFYNYKKIDTVDDIIYYVNEAVKKSLIWTT